MKPTPTEKKPTTTESLKTNFGEGVALLKTLRDEIRVDLHLAGLEAKTEWEKLEARYTEAERLGWEANAASKTAMDGMMAAYKKLRADLKGMAERHRA